MNNKMVDEKRCMGCMRPLNEFSGEDCIHCGYPLNGENPEPYLPTHTPLSDRYVVGRVWELRGDSVVYLGFDNVQKSKIFLREFFPQELCERDADGILSEKSGCDGAFVHELQAFRLHAKTLARLRDEDSLLPIYDIFEQNDTVYTVSEFCEMQSLRRYIEEIGTHLPWGQARPLFVPLMETVAALNRAGLYHLGISPDTVMLAEDGRLRLDGWQIAPMRLTGSGMTPQLKAGYAAPEQYRSGAEENAAMDVYGMTATILYALTATAPPLATDRVEKQAKLLIPAAIAGKWPTYLPLALNDGLKLDVSKRIPTMEQLQERLTGEPLLKSLRDPEAQEMRQPAAPPEPKTLKGEFASHAISDEAQESPKQRSKGLVAAVSILSVLCLLLAATTGFMAFQPSIGGGTTTTTTTMPTVTTASVAMYSVQDLTGMVFTDVADHLFNGDMPITMKYRVFSDLPRGQIVSQEPPAESMMPYGTRIDVVVSDGPEQKPIPNLAGWEAYAAQQYLESFGYRVQIQQINVSTYERGRVQETNPPVGTPLAEGSLVILMVSNMTTTRAATTTTAALAR